MFEIDYTLQKYMEMYFSRLRLNIIFGAWCIRSWINPPFWTFQKYHMHFFARKTLHYLQLYNLVSCTLDALFGKPMRIQILAQRWHWISFTNRGCATANDLLGMFEQLMCSIFVWMNGQSIYVSGKFYQRWFFFISYSFQPFKNNHYTPCHNQDLVTRFVNSTFSIENSWLAICHTEFHIALVFG